MRVPRVRTDWVTGWVEVPAGTVVMGTDVSRLVTLGREYEPLGIPAEWFAKECPAHEERVPRFFVSATLVTQGEFARAAADIGIEWARTEDDDHPAPVTMWQAVAYCEWFIETQGSSVRLLTEIEWERAARGDDAREYPWGDRFDPARANTMEAGVGGTTPVGSYPAGASPFGLLDAAGNLDEWTLTPYAPYPGAPEGVPRAEPCAISPMVTRGGGFNHTRDAARCARRHGLYRPGPVGFRLALDSEPAG